MSRAHALRKLLAHGPMTWADLLDCTGWTVDQLRGALWWLVKRGDVRKRSLFERSGHHCRNSYEALP